MNAREFLFSLERHGIKLGLDNINHLLDAAKRPERHYPTVHVAGTNGKGSVVAMVDAMLRAAGYRTGRFTSPHLIALNERFLVDGQPISDDDLDLHLGTFQRVAEGMSPPPTFFEVVTAVAFRWFKAMKVDVAVIEVGMGGRFDSTNVIVPEACAITNIAKEHTKYLGDTLGAIAFEKAGILKSGIPAVVSETQPEPRDVILARAMALDVPVSLAGRDFTFTYSGPPGMRRFSYESERLSLYEVVLGLPGGYQGANAATAVATAECLQERFRRLDKRCMRAGLGAARWPCRMERVLEDPPVVIDVAHNAAGAACLAEELSEAIVVLAVSSDKNAAAMIQAFEPMTHRLILTRFAGPRSLTADELGVAAGNRPFIKAESLDAAIAQGLALASEAHPLVITGSIFAAGEARKILMDTYGAPPLAF